MKRLFAIALLCLFTTYQVGVFFIYKALQYQHDQAWQNRFVENDFSSDQLETMSIPIRFPYMADQSEFQYVDETIILDDEHYRIVKKRYAQDTLHLVYVNDHKSKQIQKNFEQWADQINQDAGKSNSGEFLVLLRAMHFQYLLPHFVFRPLSFDNEKLTVNIHLFIHHKKVYLSIFTPPPEIIV